MPKLFYFVILLLNILLPQAALGEDVVRVNNVVEKYLYLHGLSIKRTDDTLRQMKKISSFKVLAERKPISVDDKTIYSNYKIVNTILEANKAIVILEFTLIGRIRGLSIFTPRIHKAVVERELINEQGRWFLTKDIPYYSWYSVVDRLKANLNDAFGTQGEGYKKIIRPQLDSIAKGYEEPGYVYHVNLAVEEITIYAKQN